MNKTQIEWVRNPDGTRLTRGQKTGVQAPSRHEELAGVA